MSADPFTLADLAEIEERAQSLALHAFLCRDIQAAGSLVNGAVDSMRDLVRLLAEVKRLAAAPAVVVTQGVGFTEERLRREEAERRLDEAYEYAEREWDAARREGLEEAQRIAADLSGAYLEKHGGGGDYCAALGALTMALAAKVTP